MDASTQRLLDHVKSADRPNDALPIYMGDNGHLRGAHGPSDKCAAHGASARVPLILGRLDIKFCVVSLVAA